MKATDETTVVLNMNLGQAERIETGFGKVGEIASAFRTVIHAAYRKEAATKEKALDPALIPVAITLNVTQARTILSRYEGWARESPTDRAIYLLVQKALSKE